MQDATSLLLSTLLHIGLAFGAAYYPQRIIKKKVTPQIYTLELIEAVENHTIVKQPPLITKTRHNKHPKKKVKRLITQKEKSPVQVPQAEEKVENSDREEIIFTDARLLKQKKGNKPPQYSLSDRLRKRTGRVVVIGFVNSQGDVENVRIDESTGTVSMNTNVVLAFSQYKFEENQPGWVKMPYEFLIEGESRVLSTRDRFRYQKLNR